MRRHNTKPDCSGFTLVELLVVVGIIGVVVALLVPASMRVMESARGSGCLSNLKQLAAACQMYTAENDGQNVPICTGTSSGSLRTWRILIAPYLGSSTTQVNSLYCPSDATEKLYKMSNTEKLNGARPASYGINFNSRSPVSAWDILNQYQPANPANPPAAKRAIVVVNPVATIMLCDLGRVQSVSGPPAEWKAMSASTRGANFGYARFPSDGGFNGSDAWNVFPRHGKGKANVVFFDGHAAAVDVQKDLIDHPPGDPDCIYDNY